MRRIDWIHSMSASEMADALIETGMDECVDFCKSTKECSDYEKEHGDIPQKMCRECLAKWLMEEVKK